MDKYKNQVPDRFAGMYPYMKNQNWLFNYHTKEGIEKSFRGLVHRSLYMTESNTAFILFQQYYKELNACYDELMPAIKIFAKQRIQELMAS
jgi:acyl carrier protein phosphodiesterase